MAKDVKAPTLPEIDEEFAALIARAREKLAHWKAQLPEGAQVAPQAVDTVLSEVILPMIPGLSIKIVDQLKAAVLAGKGPVVKSGASLA